MPVTSALAESTRAVWPRLLVAGTAASVALIQVVAPPLAFLAAGILVLTLVSWLAREHVVPATAAGLIAVGVLPVYAGRYVAGTQFGLTPALLVGLVLVPAALQTLPRLRLVPMDLAVAAFCLLQLGSSVLNYTGGLGLVAPTLYVSLTYAVFRLLSLRADIPTVAARTVVGVGAVAGLFAIGEHAGLGNLFYGLPANGYQYKAFATTQLRFGEVRAEASFGHSIALGMFLAMAMVLTVALAAQARSVLTRSALVVAAGLQLVGALDTLSRGALLALVVGVALWFALESRRLSFPTVMGLLLVGAALVLLTPVSATVSQLVSSSTGDTNEASSTEHRFAILDLVSDGSQFSVLGHKSTEQGGVVEQVETRTGLGSFDNAFALVYLSNGLLTVLAFLAVGVIAFVTLGSTGLTGVERAWVAALCAATLNLLTVNLLTQFRDFYWIAAAVAASTWQRVRVSRRARNDVLIRRPT